MIHSIIVESTGLQPLTLILAKPEQSLGLAVISVGELGPGSADVKETEWATIDGSTLGSVRRGSRVIPIELQFVAYKRNVSIADVRRTTYKYFQLGKKIKLTFCNTSSFGKETKYWIEGVVTMNNPNIWSNEEGTSIEVTCGDPYFKDSEETDGSFSEIIQWFRFGIPEEPTYPDGVPNATYKTATGWLPDMDLPFKMVSTVKTDELGNTFTVDEFLLDAPVSERINYALKRIIVSSTVTIGCIFKFETMGPVVNPVIYNLTTGDIMRFNHTFSTGEKMIIDTRKGYKSIRSLDGKNTNLLNYLDIKTAQWITLVNGENVLGLYCDDGFENVELSYNIRPIYQGI